MTTQTTTTSPPEANCDESRVPAYTLPDPLVHGDGTPVRDAEEWFARRRPELLDLFARNMYGITPSAAIAVHIELRAEEPQALNGVATRLELDVMFGDRAAPMMTVLVYLPNALQKPVPLFLGLNFHGNHTINADSGITLPQGWVPNNAERSIADNRAREVDRGLYAQHWPVERILERGYGLATVYCGDIDPDWDDGFQNGVHALYSVQHQNAIAPGDWGTVGAWAWGLSRAMDACVTVPAIDPARIAVMGHSRLGKAALWAGAQDERFALVIANNAGSCGTALSRRRFGETLEHINTRFPHWFCRAFHQYNDREDALPLDQHELIALIAPRAVYVASAAADLWADPRGEFLAARHADPVYRLLGTNGITIEALPEVEQPITSRIGYHLRPGPHGVTAYDWEQFLSFADRYLEVE